MTVYENRSDTAVISITQKFQTSYTPKHADGEYPDDVDGPVKTLTQDAGIAPYGTRTLYWQVCAPELASKQNPVPLDGTDSFMSEIGAQPRAPSFSWLAGHRAGMSLMPQLGRDGDGSAGRAHAQARLPVIMECRVP